MNVPGKWIDRAGQRRSLDKLILDLNSSVSQTYRRQECLGDQRPAKPVRCIALLAVVLPYVVRQTVILDVLDCFKQLDRGTCI